MAPGGDGDLRRHLGPDLLSQTVDDVMTSGPKTIPPDMLCAAALELLNHGKITTLFVTHGQDEALALADRIVVMRDGKTEQIAPPDLLYRQPATPFVAGFIGTMNLVDGAIAAGRFQHPAFGLPVPAPEGPATLAVRPEALAITPAEGPAAATVHRVTDFGTHAIVDIDLADGQRLKAMVPDARAWRAGTPLDLAPRAFAIYRDNAALHRSDG